MPKKNVSTGAPGAIPSTLAKRTKQSALARSSAERPLIPLEEVQSAAHDLLGKHPTLTDDQLTLVILHTSTSTTIAHIARKLGASKGWAYAQLRRPEVQSFMAELALSTLGVGAIRALTTVSKLTRSKDQRVALEASQDLLNRAGLGNRSEQRSVPAEGFAFAFAPPRLEAK